MERGFRQSNRHARRRLPRGGLLQSTTCFFSQVKQEVQAQKQLTVSDMGSGPSPCAALSESLSKLNTQMKQGLDSLKGQLQGQANLADLMNCKNTWDSGTPASTEGGALDQGPLRQSAQQLCSARSAIESTFTQLAACEIFARAQYSYLQNIAGTTQQSAIFKAIQTGVQETCSKQCEDQLGGSRCNIPSDEAVSSCANKCYQSKCLT